MWISYFEDCIFDLYNYYYHCWWGFKGAIFVLVPSILDMESCLSEMIAKISGFVDLSVIVTSKLNIIPENSLGPKLTEKFTINNWLKIQSTNLSKRKINLLSTTVNSMFKLFKLCIVSQISSKEEKTDSGKTEWN